jgi:hypothetical protein
MPWFDTVYNLYCIIQRNTNSQWVLWGSTFRYLDLIFRQQVLESQKISSTEGWFSTKKSQINRSLGSTFRYLDLIFRQQVLESQKISATQGWFSTQKSQINGSYGFHIPLPRSHIETTDRSLSPRRFHQQRVAFKLRNSK